MWETRRTRGDLIQKFKDTTNIDEINWEVKPVALPLRGGQTCAESLFF